MSREECFDVIKTKIVEIREFTAEEAQCIHYQSHIDYNGIGMDSLQLLTLLVCLEEECGFELSDTDLSLTQFTKINDLVSMICEKCN